MIAPSSRGPVSEAVLGLSHRSADDPRAADAVHEQIAARDLAGGLVEAEPHLAGDVLVGAAACLMLDDLVAEHLVECWEGARSSLFPASSGAMVAPA